MFYHISLDTNKIIDKFTPRIPNEQSRFEGENRTVPRICIAPKIEDCLTGFSQGGYLLEGKCPFYIRVYEFDESQIKRDNLISNTTLFFQGVVPDAWVTGEYWVVNQSIYPNNSYILEIKEVEICDAPFFSKHQFEEAIRDSVSVQDIVTKLEKECSATIARVEKIRYKKLF